MLLTSKAIPAVLVIVVLVVLSCTKDDVAVPTGPPSEVMLTDLLDSPETYSGSVIVTEGAFLVATLDGLPLLFNPNEALKGAESGLTIAYMGRNSHPSLDCVDGLARATGFVDDLDGPTLFVYRLDTRRDRSEAWVNCFDSTIPWQ